MWVWEHGESRVLKALDSLDSILINSLLRPTKQGITEVNAVVLCMVVDVSDLLSGSILHPQSTMPQENTGRK